MKAIALSVLVSVVLIAGCGGFGIGVQFVLPADATATALAASTRTAPTSTPDRDATAAVERAVRQTLTAAVPSPTSTLPTSPTPEPTATLPPTETPLPTATETSTPPPIPTRPTPPQIVFLRPLCGSTYSVQSGRPLEIHYGSWIANGEDLAKQNAQHLIVRLLIDGQPVAGVQQPVAHSSTIPCSTPLENGYGVYSVARVGALSPGTHVATMTLMFDEQVTDGYDVDGDGTPDLYGPGEIRTREFTIIAQ